MSFINFNNQAAQTTQAYTPTMVMAALLAIETKSVAKARTMVSGLNESVTLSEALSLFSNKLNAMSALNAAAIEYKPLLEGQFSWLTHDRAEQIGSERENKIDVWMFDNEGNMWFEKNYEGYGVFGNMDYYELMCKMNGYSEEDVDQKLGRRNRIYRELREIGIGLAFGDLETRDEKGKVLFPALMSDPSGFTYKRHDFTKEALSDPNQSWYQEEEDDDYDEYDESVANESQENDVLASVKAIRDFNRSSRGAGDINQLAVDIIKNLGFRAVDPNVTNTIEHLANSTDRNEKIPEDRTLVRELYSILESKVNEGAMSDIDIIAQEAKDFKSFVKEFKKEYKNMDAGNPKELEAWLQGVYDAAKENMDESRVTEKDEAVFIEFLNKAKNFKKDTKRFKSYDEAVKWAKANFDKFSPDMIKYESVTEAKYKPAGLTKEETLKVAETYAKAISKLDGVKCTVNMKTLEEDSFDLDLPGDEYAGGSYSIDADDNVYNDAMGTGMKTPPIYGKSNDSVDAIVKTIKKLNETKTNEAMMPIAVYYKDSDDSVKATAREIDKIIDSLEFLAPGSKDRLLDLITDLVENCCKEVTGNSAIGTGYNEATITEGRSINKIQKEWSEVTTQMKAAVEDWKKAPEGELKTSLFAKLKSLTQRKKELEAELDAVVQLVDVDVELAGESFVYEAEIKSDDEFKEYAFTILKKAFGTDFDEAKAQKTVDGILSKAKNDYGKAIGMLTAGLGESVINKPSKAERWMNLLERLNKSINEDLRADLKKYIKSNANELNSFADDDNWDSIYNMLRTDFDVKEGSKEEETLFTTFNFVF